MPVAKHFPIPFPLISLFFSALIRFFFSSEVQNQPHSRQSFSFLMYSMHRLGSKGFQILGCLKSMSNALASFISNLVLHSKQQWKCSNSNNCILPSPSYLWCSKHTMAYSNLSGNILCKCSKISYFLNYLFERVLNY